MPATGSYDEIALLSNIAKGDEAAFRTLFERYWDNIYGVAFAFTKSPVLAEEIVPGAVYNPELEMVPTVELPPEMSLTHQVTCLEFVPVTFAENCRV